MTLNTMKGVAFLGNHTLPQACAFNQWSYLHEISEDFVIAKSRSLKMAVIFHLLQFGRPRTKYSPMKELLQFFGVLNPKPYNFLLLRAYVSHGLLAMHAIMNK